MQRRHALMLAAALAAQGASAQNCSVAVSALAFGNYNPIAAAPTDGLTLVRIQCSGINNPNNVKLQLAIPAPSGSNANRTLSSGANTLRYGLYSDVARTTAYPTNLGQGREARLDANLSASDPIYGRLPPLQQVAPGAYAETLTLWLRY